jgi:hypothetical protein
MKIKIILIIGIILLSFTHFVKAQGMPGEVIPQSQSALDSYFVTNATPSQLAYWELIDTMFFYVQMTYSNSLAAAQSAATVSNSQFCVTAIFSLAYDGTTPSVTMLHANGFSSNSWAFVSGNQFMVTNYFASPMPDMLWTNGIETNWVTGHDYNQPTFQLGASSQNFSVFQVNATGGSVGHGMYYLEILK